MASAVRCLMRCAPTELKAFMPVVYEITHRTVYRYNEPVRFGEHRVLFRPFDSHDLRVLAADLRNLPRPRSA
jgi:transglutaminase-like putative cysteine protease